MKSWAVMTLLALAMGCDGRVAAVDRNDQNDGDNDNGGDNDSGGNVDAAFVAHIVRPNGNVSILTSASTRLEAEFYDSGNMAAPAEVTWTSSLAGALGTGNPLDGVSLAAGTHVITVTGTLGDKTASDQVTVTVSAMSVRISSPDDGARITVGSDIDFTGQASHDDSGNIVTLVTGTPAGGERAATFAWSSSLAGAFGGGAASFTTNTLTAGTHTITLTVTDDQAGGSGDSATAQIVLVVLPPNTAPSVVITAPASCPVTLEQGTALMLAGTVTDADSADAGLTGEWFDSLTGLLASGNDASLAATAELGKHTLVFRASDAQGASDEATCDVFVVAAGQSASDLFPPTDTMNNALPGGDQNIRWIGADSAGNTWIGNSEGLVIFDADQNITGGPYDGDDLATDPGNTVRVNDAFITTGGALIATEEGLAMCTYTSGALLDCQELSGGDYDAVSASTDSSIVAAGRDGGLFLAEFAGADLVDSETFTPDNSNLPGDRVRDVLVDGSIVYAATDEGLCIVTDVAGAFEDGDALCSAILDRDNSLLPANEVRALAQDGDMLWIGADDGLVWYDPATGAMIIYDEGSGMASSSVNDIVVDADGVVWIGTSEGLSRFDPEIGLFTNFSAADWGGTSSEVRSLFIDASDTVWIGTEEGLFRYSGA